MHVIELGVMMLLGLVVLFMVVRPLVKRILASEGAVARGRRAAQPAPGRRSTDGSAAAAGGASHETRTRCHLQPTASMIDVAQVQGQVHAQSVHRVGELAERNPNETASISVNGSTRTRRNLTWPYTANRRPDANDIANVIGDAGGQLASRPQATPASASCSGPKRAAILMLALGEQYGGKVWSLLDDDEVRELSIAMSTLGTVEADVVEDLLLEFVVADVGLRRADGQLRRHRTAAAAIPAARARRTASWTKSAAPPAATCGRSSPTSRKRCSPTTSRTNIRRPSPWCCRSSSRSTPRGCSRSCPRTWRSTSSTACCKMEAVQKEVIERVEQTLRTEFMSNLSQTRRRDAHEVMAEIFNNFDRQTETRFITSLEEDNREAAERIKALMFTFDDLIKLDAGSAQTLMRHVDKDKLGDRAEERQRGGAPVLPRQHVVPRRQDADRRHGGDGPGAAARRRRGPGAAGQSRQGSRGQGRNH